MLNNALNKQAISNNLAVDLNKTDNYVNYENVVLNSSSSKPNSLPSSHTPPKKNNVAFAIFYYIFLFLVF